MTDVPEYLVLFVQTTQPWYDGTDAGEEFRVGICQAGLQRIHKKSTTARLEANFYVKRCMAHGKNKVAGTADTQMLVRVIAVQSCAQRSGWELKSMHW